MAKKKSNDGPVGKEADESVILEDENQQEETQQAAPVKEDESLPPMPKIDENKELEFITPAFNFRGKEYKSADVKAAVEAGDHDAQLLVLELIRYGQVVEVEPKKEGN